VWCGVVKCGTVYCGIVSCRVVSCQSDDVVICRVRCDVVLRSDKACLFLFCLGELYCGPYLEVFGNNLQDIVMKLSHGDSGEVSQFYQGTQNSQHGLLRGLRTVF
jgi:hypothetical protein